MTESLDPRISKINSLLPQIDVNILTAALIELAYDAYVIYPDTSKAATNEEIFEAIFRMEGLKQIYALTTLLNLTDEKLDLLLTESS
jgi:hypothetical protein